jgi:Predicted transcriptional regulator containing the HTH domain
MTCEERMKIEALLFASSKPLPIREISRLSGLTKKKVKRITDSLNREYNKHAFEIVETGEGLVMQVKESFYEVVKDFMKPEISEKLLQTLSIIAHSEPVKQSHLREIIGERIYEDVRKLCKMDLIKYTQMQSTKILSTTPEFKRRFKLDKTL